MRKVITFGVFDYFHIGHLNLLEQAKKLGDVLTVAVQEGDSILKYKPDEDIRYTTEERIRLIRMLKIVDSVVTYRDVDQDIQSQDFDIFAVGEDQTHDGFQRAVQWCRVHGKSVVYLKYTPGISSTEIKKSRRNENEHY